jgi:Zn-dependent protease
VSARFRPSPLFLGIVALFVVGGVLAWRDAGPEWLGVVGVFLFVLAGWVVSLCLHEYAHAVAAYNGGDRGVAERGYLTLDPVKYTHPVLSIVLPLIFLVIGGIGLPGGAVWVDHGRLRSRGWDSFVSFAGPAVNLLCAFVLVVPFAVGVDTFAHERFWAALALLAFLELTASILNFLPVPGIDGGNLVEPWLSPQWQRGFRLVAPYGMLALFVLLFSTQLNSLFFGFVYAVADAIGLPRGLVAEGYFQFQFWRR